MKKEQKATEARDNLKLAEGLRKVKGIEGDDQEALYGLVAMLGGLELLRHSADSTEAWGNEVRGLGDELAPHLDGIEAVLNKYRDGILYETPEVEQATA